MKLLLFASASGAVATATALDSKGFGRYTKLHDEVVSLRAKNAAMADDNLKLAREVDGLQHDPAFQERAVRQELGLIRPGDMILELEEPRVVVPVPPLVVRGPR